MNCNTTTPHHHINSWICYEFWPNQLRHILTPQALPFHTQGLTWTPNQLKLNGNFNQRDCPSLSTTITKWGQEMFLISGLARWLSLRVMMISHQNKNFIISSLCHPHSHPLLGGRGRLPSWIILLILSSTFQGRQCLAVPADPELLWLRPHPWDRARVQQQAQLRRDQVWPVAGRGRVLPGAGREGDRVRPPLHQAGSGLQVGAGPVLHPHQQTPVWRDLGAVQGQRHLQVTIPTPSLLTPSSDCSLGALCCLTESN